MRLRLSLLAVALFFIMPDLAFSDGGLLPRDNRNHPALGGVDSDDQDGEVFALLLDPITGELLVKASMGGGTSDTNLIEIGGTAVSVGSGVLDAGTLRVVLATDQPVVSIDDNAGSLTIDGTVTANAGTGTFTSNVAQIAGTTTSTGSGVLDAGTQRVVLATDQPVISVDDNGATLSIDDGGGIITVDGTVDTEIITGDLDTGGGSDVHATVGLRLAETGGSVLVGSGNPLPISDAGGSLTIDGTVTANAGTGTFATNVSQIAGTATSTGSGVLDAGTQRVVLATDQPVVSVDDNGATLSIDDGAGSLTIDGTVTANAGTGNFSTNIAQVGGTAVSIGSGVLDAGTMRVVLATDQPVVSVDDNGATLSIDDGGGSLTIDSATLATESTLSDVELNTDSPTGFGSAVVSVTTTATEILAADSARRFALVRNADSNTVLFTGPTSGVTTANGIPVATAGASGATGNGGTVIYTHTAAIWGIVASGTADVRVQTESD